MLTNAMFYEIGGSSDPSTTLKLGPFEFSPAQIGIGVMSSLVIFPVNLLIVGKSVLMFYNANRMFATLHVNIHVAKIG